MTAASWSFVLPALLPRPRLLSLSNLVVVEPDLRSVRPTYLDFLDAIEKAPAVRTLESLARIEAGAQGGVLLERVTTTRISKSGVATTTVRERFTAPDWHADGWFWTGLGGRSSSC